MLAPYQRLARACHGRARHGEAHSVHPSPVEMGVGALLVLPHCKMRHAQEEGVRGAWEQLVIPASLEPLRSHGTAMAQPCQLIPATSLVEDRSLSSALATCTEPPS
jgi:hypothetical protein